MYGQPKVQVHFVFLFGGAIEVDVFAWALCFLPVVVETRDFSSTYMLCLDHCRLSLFLNVIPFCMCILHIQVLGQVSPLLQSNPSFHVWSTKWKAFTVI